MSKQAKIITLVIVFLIAVGISAYGIITGEEAIMDVLPKMIITLISFAIVIIKISTGQSNGRKSLAFYENHYKKEVEHAFAYDAKSKKKLLEATRLYDENKFNTSLKILAMLKDKCEYWEDSCAVGLFEALNYTDMGQTQKAYEVYKELIDRLDANETVYINMGHLLQTVYHEEDRAVDCYEKAIRKNPNSALAYNNLASLYFDTGEWEEAVKNAKKALEISPKTYQAASLLAIVYACMKNEEESAKYFAVAVSAGEDKATLTKAIDFYKRK